MLEATSLSIEQQPLSKCQSVFKITRPLFVHFCPFHNSLTTMLQNVIIKRFATCFELIEPQHCPSFSCLIGSFYPASSILMKDRDMKKAVKNKINNLDPKKSVIRTPKICRPNRFETTGIRCELGVASRRLHVGERFSHRNR